MIRSMIGLAKLYSAKQDYNQAIVYFKQAENIAAEIDAALELEDLYDELATAHQKMGDFKNAYQYKTLYSQVKDSLYNADADKRVATLQFDFDLEKKQNEINLLTKDKSIQELELKKQETFKNALVVVLSLIVVVVFVLYRSYRIKAKTNVMLDRKNMEIERLLLNILPTEVAHELQTTGKATPRNYEQVSVMFTDFKGFTTLADKMTPQDLVTELNNCFIAFDSIMEKYGLEKIKTIGDSYMCAGGIPTLSEDHIFNIVKASLEIQEYVNQNNLKRKEAGFAPWDIRIGIHVGPVVAGVVGKKKYAYDIWGTTVNIASRMESSGMPGHVNISSATYEIIKHKYACVYRGKIHAKNVGDIDMYLIDHELESATGFRSLEEVEKKEEPICPVPSGLLQ
jgi:class 3 adenylate cyclase